MTSEKSVKMLKQSLSNNINDVRDLRDRVDELEKDINDLKTRHSVTDETIMHVHKTLNEIKTDFKDTDDKLDNHVRNINREIKASNERLHMSQIEQLKQYKVTLWTVGGSVVGSVIVAGIVFLLNI